MFQKLAAKYYGPFEVLEKIGQTAYRLRLLLDLKIHHVFHISQLKHVLGNHHEVNQLPKAIDTTEKMVTEPTNI